MGATSWTLLGALSLLVKVVLGIPQRGHHPWSVVLCKYAGNPSEPRAPAWFQAWMTGVGFTGSIQGFFDGQSNGLYDISRSNVHGWMQLRQSKREVSRLARADPVLRKIPDVKLQLFYKSKELCVAEARRRRLPLHPNLISVVNDESTAVFCKESGVLLTPKFFLSSALAHEMGHGLNLGHSYSDSPKRIFPHSAAGEYDDKYDLMSTANAYMHRASFGMNGPGLNGPHLDYLGWLPASRMFLFGREGRKEAVVRLASLSVPHADSRGYLLLLLPYDRDDPTNVFTLEYRTPHGADKGIRDGAVVIHKLLAKDGYRYSQLVTQGRRYYELVRGSEWSHTFPASSTHGTMFIRVRFMRSSSVHHSADVHVMTTFEPLACLEDEVPRGVTPDDSVCVPAAQSEALRLSRPTTMGPGGVCPDDLLPRAAMEGDRACVSAKEKALSDAQNETWHRRSMFFARKTFGLNACRSPSDVWRQIDARDFACVSSARRSAVRRQNRRFTIGGACVGGLVERAAFDGDAVCVREAERDAAREENLAQPQRLAYYAFFNGVDTVTLPKIHSPEVCRGNCRRA